MNKKILLRIDEKDKNSSLQQAINESGISNHFMCSSAENNDLEHINDKRRGFRVLIQGVIVEATTSTITTSGTTDNNTKNRIHPTIRVLSLLGVDITNQKERRQLEGEGTLSPSISSSPTLETTRAPAPDNSSSSPPSFFKWLRKLLLFVSSWLFFWVL